ncbi:MAG: hypothetical protein QG647_528 [Patescibacteria group bacterium]|nr:hypothetical protein [Patescibacteria group bacterium]
MDGQNFIEKRIDVSNPVVTLIIVLIIASTMVVITTSMFLRSGAYQTVKQIQNGIKATSESDLSGYDTTSPIQSSDIEKFTENLGKNTGSINNEKDYQDPVVDYQGIGIN